MSQQHQIRCYEYVNHPYDVVCDALSAKAAEIFHEATKSAVTRAESVAAGLHVSIAGIELGKDIAVTVNEVQRTQEHNRHKTVIQFEWEAANSPRLFPVMNAELAIYPITSTETQLDFLGNYVPPLGMLGKAIDSIVGRRIADACVHRFLAEVAFYLRTHLATSGQ